MSGTETLFRIAKIGETDPIGNFDSVLLTNEFGMDWLRWVFDPYSQLQYDLQPDPSSFAGILARIGRYAFGASSWSFIWASVLTIDRVHQAEYLAQISREPQVTAAIPISRSAGCARISPSWATSRATGRYRWAARVSSTSTSHRAATRRVTGLPGRGDWGMREESISRIRPA